MASNAANMHQSSNRKIEARRAMVQIRPAAPTSAHSTFNSGLSIQANGVLYPKSASGDFSKTSKSTDVERDSRSSSSDAVLQLQSSENEGRMRPLARQTHTKSRRGCYNCKRRRIKCAENRPSCSQCTKRGLNCEWPMIQIREVGIVVKQDASSPSIPMQVQSANPTFTMQDFRLFHRFIQGGYPHHPLGNDSVWTHEIPSISHNYDYLLHAMLALSASEMATEAAQASEFVYTAMFHRVQAIKSLNQALSKGINTVEEGNALLATCYVLIFQSVLVDDGLAEYMTFARGCALVMGSMWCKRLKFLFSNMLPQHQLSVMDPHLNGAPAICRESVDTACSSLEAFGPLCQREYEKSFHRVLLKMARSLYTSSREAYMSLMDVYGSFITMAHEDFQEFINPKNDIGRLLQSHFIAVQHLLDPITINERLGRNPGKRTDGTARWLDAIHRNIAPPMRKYFEWPISIADTVRAEYRKGGSESGSEFLTADEI